MEIKSDLFGRILRIDKKTVNPRTQKGKAQKASKMDKKQCATCKKWGVCECVDLRGDEMSALLNQSTHLISPDKKSQGGDNEQPQGSTQGDDETSNPDSNEIGSPLDNVRKCTPVDPDGENGGNSHKSSPSPSVVSSLADGVDIACQDFNIKSDELKNSYVVTMTPASDFERLVEYINDMAKLQVAHLTSYVDQRIDDLKTEISDDLSEKVEKSIGNWKSQLDCGIDTVNDAVNDWLKNMQDTKDLMKQEIKTYERYMLDMKKYLKEVKDCTIELKKTSADLPPVDQTPVDDVPQKKTTIMSQTNKETCLKKKEMDNFLKELKINDRMMENLVYLLFMGTDSFDSLKTKVQKMDLAYNSLLETAISRFCSNNLPSGKKYFKNWYQSTLKKVPQQRANIDDDELSDLEGNPTSSRSDRASTSLGVRFKRRK